MNYKEALTKTVQHREVFKKQTGGRGKFADIIFEIGPADEGTMGLTFVDEVKGGNIPKEFIPAVQKGFAAAMANGALAGYTMDSDEGYPEGRFVPPGRFRPVVFRNLRP